MAQRSQLTDKSIYLAFARYQKDSGIEVTLKYIRSAPNVSHGSASTYFSQAKKQVEAEDAGQPFTPMDQLGSKKAVIATENTGEPKKTAAGRKRKAGLVSEDHPGGGAAVEPRPKKGRKETKKPNEKSSLDGQEASIKPEPDADEDFI